MADATGLLKNATEFCATRRCAEAAAVWEQASLRSPADPDIHFQLGFCYAGGCGVRSLLNPEVAILHYRRSLSLLGEENSVARAMVLGALGNAYVTGARHAGPQLLSAVHCYEEAAERYAGVRKLDDWAREEFNLGNAWCDMPEEEFPEKWKQAIEHYELALSVRTRLKDTGHYAATLQNLGTAYRELKTGNPPENIRKAIVCYHRALRASRGAAAGKKRADLHHNLGNAYLTLAIAEGDIVQNTLRAIRHFDRALSSRTKAEWSFDYAATQFSRGQAFVRLASSGAGASNLAQARACFAEAIEAFSQSGQTRLAHEARKRLDVVALHG